MPVRPSPSMVVAMTALFVALSGTAVALTGQNTVDSGDIKPGNVRTSDIDQSAVTGTKLAPGSVGANQIANGAVTGTEVAPDSLTGAHVLESSLGTVPAATSANSATTAGSATTAATAGDANTLDGLNNTIFEKRSRIVTAGGSNNITDDQTIISVTRSNSTWEILNDGDVDGTAEIRIRSVSGIGLHVNSAAGSVSVATGNTSAQIDADSGVMVNLANNLTVSMLINCQVDTVLSNDPIVCWAIHNVTPN